MTEAGAETERSSGYSMRGLQGRVIEAIGLDVVGGRYRPGQLLPREAELMVEYGVSRTSLREAMKVLAAKGLVDIRQKVGTRVRPVEMWNAFDSDLLAWFHASGQGEAPMRDLVELRQVLEPAAARFAATRATMADLHDLERAQQAMLDTAHDHAGYAATDVAFHLAVYGASHNALLRRFGHLVADFMHLSFDVQQHAAADGPADFTEDAQGHAAIFEAINRGDADAAAEAMLQVVLDGKSALIKALSHRGTAESRGTRGAP
ncbi:regulatory protein GntR HTH [Beutenbergia cavernae DSM 12333]|uniref:Regulatory protein GntR HTH n=1 Tax=Beutenbergia cavernae (strain ATCC BAA-8 / DSM 12333 / CCUG 43141 / JCM 11478 / NBRC 16432 / NCIMB 13614 / HKI 0122) TaxID=471853 RepID=C5BV14_BEUC1|nr:FadR/GntR family transcriptional regulator [Beutenbergia cavernae]ACQ78388.1 regulatory protein GntR HTH [Beutenbergia cavernae DSM 12333]